MQHTLPHCAGAYRSPLLLCTPQAGYSTPDVWLQLLEHCASISSCQPALIRDLGLQLVEQQQLGSSLQEQCRQQQQQQIAQQQQVINQLQEANTQQQQRAALHHQQLAAVAAAATAVDLRVAALEGQVAQLMQALQRDGCQ